MSVLGRNALDIDVDTAELCLILGYLASPERIGLIEAQIPEDKVFLFEREFPNAPYYPIKQGETKSGNVMKQGCQLRIYFNNINNCPPLLLPFLGEGNSSYIKRINKGKFVEKIVKKYGFVFGENQSITTIRAAVLASHPANMIDFEQGFNL
jgi:hypothetical protein